MFTELFHSIISHKTRTASAVLSVSWGVFMLIVLLGTGRGLQNGVQLQFSDEAINSLRIFGGQTKIANSGLPREIPVYLDTADLDIITSELAIVERSSATYDPEEQYVSVYKQRHGVFQLRGIFPEQLYVEKNKVTSGRYINTLDIEHRRKTVVIGEYVKKVLFGFEEPIGKRIRIGGYLYTVVGTFADSGDRSQEALIYLPISTAQSVFSGYTKIDSIALTMQSKTNYNSTDTETKIKGILAERHGHSPSDGSAVYIINNWKEYQKIFGIFTWVEWFVVLVGMGTILSGVIAVANIMMVTVSERVKEIGIRKAVGATPGNITLMIVTESVVIVSGAGVLGIVAGVGLMEVLQLVIEKNEFMYQPAVEGWVCGAVFTVVLIAGVLSGYFPASKASRVNPIEALTA